MFCESRPAIPEEEGAEYLKRCAQYARHAKVYLVPGLFILRERLCSCLISPQGKLLALQQATCLNLLQHPTLTFFIRRRCVAPRRRVHRH